MSITPRRDLSSIFKPSLLRLCIGDALGIPTTALTIGSQHASATGGDPIMFRASTVEDGSHVLITVDGQLSGEYVEFVDACCEQASASGKPVHLLLQDVRLVDEAGRRLLRSLAAKGVCLRANGVYNSHLIRECGSGLRSCNTKPPGHTADPV